MFQVGKALKVKVEISPDMIGFGRATVIEAQRNSIYLQISTENKNRVVLPKGSHIWFVTDEDNLPFAGWWTTTVRSTRTIKNKQTVECTKPIFESIRQKRKSARAIYKCPIELAGKKWAELPSFSSHNISSSGVKIETNGDWAKDFKVQSRITMIIKSRSGPIRISATVIQARYNWLANKTSIGLEFISPSKTAAAKLEELLHFLDTTPLRALSGKKENNLSAWLKSTKKPNRPPKQKK